MVKGHIVKNACQLWRIVKLRCNLSFMICIIMTFQIIKKYQKLGGINPKSKISNLKNTDVL